MLPESRRELAALVAENGDALVAAEIGISPQTLARILAGLTVVGGSRAAVFAYLGAPSLPPSNK